MKDNPRVHIGWTKNCVWCGKEVKDWVGCGTLSRENDAERVQAHFCSDTCLEYMTKLYWSQKPFQPWRKWEEKRDGIVLFEQPIEV